MNHGRTTLLAISAAAALTAAACGSDTASPSGSQAPAPMAALEQLQALSTSVDVDPATAGVLKQNGVSVAPVGPATASTAGGGLTVSFPITDGFVSLYDPSQLPFVRGSISHSGGLTFSAGGKSLTATDFVINPGTSVLTATVGGKGVRLLDLNGSGVKITKDASGNVHLDGTIASLSQPAADALNSTFGVQVFKRGIVIGVAHIVATGKPSPGGVPQAEVPQLSGVGTTVDVDAGTAMALKTNGVAVATAGGATASTAGGGLSVTFPITNGYVALYNELPTIRGLISHAGGLTFSAGGKSLTVTDFMVNPGTSELMATVGDGKVVPLLDLDGSQAKVTKADDGTVHVDGTVAKLSTTAASALNSTFGVTLFKQGIPLGVVHIVAMAAPSS